LKTEQNIGMLEIHGELIGENKDISELLKELTISELKLIVHMEFLLILGPMMLETLLNQLKSLLNQKMLAFQELIEINLV